MWIYTEAVVCNGLRNMENFMMNKMTSITEAAMGSGKFSMKTTNGYHKTPLSSQNAKFFGVFATRYRSSVRRAVEDVVVLGSNQPLQ